MICASIDCENLMTVGDPNQLTPNVPMIRPAGCTKELSRSAMDYIRANHWPSVKLTMQRRSSPGMMLVPSYLFYGDRIVDAPCTFLPGNHPKTASILKYFKTKFPKCKSDLPFRFIQVQGNAEVQDEITGSYFNLDVASVVGTLTQELIMEGIVDPEDVPQITHYTAQQRIYDHFFAQIHEEFPEYGFDQVKNFTTDTFQGDDATCPFGDPVRTLNPGFTSAKGRNCVIFTRGEDFMVIAANVQNLKNPNNEIPPYMVQAFNKAKKLKACIVIQPGGHNDYMMNHEHIKARVLGTEGNVEAVHDQAATINLWGEAGAVEPVSVEVSKLANETLAPVEVSGDGGWEVKDENNSSEKSWKQEHEKSNSTWENAESNGGGNASAWGDEESKGGGKHGSSW